MVLPLEFDSIPWESPQPGLYQKLIEKDGRALRLAKFTHYFIEEGWCEKPHEGVIIKGELIVQFEDTSVTYREGEDLNIPPERHKVTVVSKSVCLTIEKSFQ